MEVMLEIYRTLSVLEMEWKEKRFLGNLGGKKTNHEKARVEIERTPEMDGAGVETDGERERRRARERAEREREEEDEEGLPLDTRAASSIYYVEARARVDNVVVSILYFHPLFPLTSTLRS